jgi:hypothetical protein
MTTVRRIEIPVVTTEQRVKYAILCALEVCQEPSFVTWANKWLSGEDRSERSAAARASASAVSSASAWSASAESAACSARSAVAVAVGWAASAVEYAQHGKPSIDLLAIARKAVEIKNEL